MFFPPNCGLSEAFSKRFQLANRMILTFTRSSGPKWSWTWRRQRNRFYSINFRWYNYMILSNWVVFCWASRRCRDSDMNRYEATSLTNEALFFHLQKITSFIPEIKLARATRRKTRILEQRNGKLSRAIAERTYNAKPPPSCSSRRLRCLHL